jgi:cyanophycinase
MKSILLFVTCWLPTWLCAEQAKPAQGLLIGGGLKICSSFSTSGCIKKVSFDRKALSQKLFESNQNRLATIQQQWLHHFHQRIPENLLVLLKRLNQRSGKQVFTKKEFSQKLKSINAAANQNGAYVIANLSDQQWYFLLDHYEKARVDAEGRMLEEQLNLSQSHPDSLTIVEQFMDMSEQVAHAKGKEKTTILVSTASAKDVYDAVSFYTQLFKRDQVEVYWLPIEAAIQKIWHENKSCDELPDMRAKISQVYDRQRVYPNLAAFQLKMCQQPELLSELITHADGLFFNGGDQTLTLQSLATIDSTGTHFSQLYKLIKQRFQSGDLALSGSSAGSAVMGGGQLNQKNIPMVNNGDSLYGLLNGSQPKVIPPTECGGELGCELDELSYLPSGGFDFFSLAVFDTHFSERNRQYRLARLLHDTSSAYGIGLDENTALQIMVKPGQINFKTLGQGNVWFFTNKTAQSKPSVTNQMQLALAILGKEAKAAWIKSTTERTWHFDQAQWVDNHPWITLLNDAKEQPQNHSLNFSIQDVAFKVTTSIKRNNQSAVWPYEVTLHVSRSVQSK